MFRNKNFKDFSYKFYYALDGSDEGHIFLLALVVWEREIRSFDIFFSSLR